MWAFATARVEAGRLFGLVAEVAEGRLGEFNPQNLANTVWAFATARVEAGRLFGLVAEAAEGRLGEFNPQDLANTAWAFVVAGQVPVGSSFLRLAWGQFAFYSSSSVAFWSGSATELNQWAIVEQGTRLHSSQLRLLDSAPSLGPSPRHCSLRRLLSASLSVFDACPSALQRAVSVSLLSFGWKHEYEAFLEDEGASVDCLQRSSRTVLEVDGPTHFLKSVTPSGEPSWFVDGPTAFKRQRLQSLGWRVVQIPFYEWDEVARQGEVARAAYLRHKLA